MPAIRRLIAKAGNIKHAFSNSHVTKALNEALNPVACRIRGTIAHTAGTPTYAPAIYRPTAGTTGPYATAASQCPIPSTVQKVGPFNRNPINAEFAGGFWRDGDPARMPKDWEFGPIRFTER